MRSVTDGVQVILGLSSISKIADVIVPLIAVKMSYLLSRLRQANETGSYKLMNIIFFMLSAEKYLKIAFLAIGAML